MTEHRGRDEAGRSSWVVVPARDEERRIGAALAAIGLAAAGAAGHVHLIVVDDGSTDRTAEIVDRCVDHWSHGRAERVPGPAMGSGPARAAGLELALTQAAHADALIATTDADSVVPLDWFAAMHRLLDDGAHVIAGDVRLERHADPRLVAARAERLLERLAHVRGSADPRAPHPHFAGANLGFSSRALGALAPLPAPAALEDDALRERCEALGLPIVRDASFPVTTSARIIGRAAAGLATALASDAVALGLV
ncbi:MAG: glycosyltransferase family A protein [Patulibacter minatonensis]